MSRVLQGKGVLNSVEKLKKHLAGGGGGSSRKQLLLRADEAVKVRFLEEPDQWMIFYEHYDSEQKKFVPAIENDPLANHENERIKRASERYLVNVVNTDNGQVQLLKLGKDLANRLLMRYQRANTILDRDYEIMRTGSGLETTYDVEAGAVSPMDLSQFKNKVIDKEHYLLEQVDDYYGTSHAEEYLAEKGTSTSDAPLTEEEAPKVEPAAKPVEKTQAELDAENPLLDEEDKEQLPWETEKSAGAVMDLNGGHGLDQWAANKAQGYPCVEGADGLCQICSHKPDDCVIAT